MGPIKRLADGEASRPVHVFSAELDKLLKTAREHVDTEVVDVVIVGDLPDEPRGNGAPVRLAFDCVDRGVRLVIPAEGIDTACEQHCERPASPSDSGGTPTVGAVCAGLAE